MRFKVWYKNVSMWFHFWLTCLSIRADTDERGNAVDAPGARAAWGCSTVINVFRAVGAAPPINAHADVATDQVAACASILAGVWLQTTLIHIFCTVLTCGGVEARTWSGGKHIEQIKLMLCGFAPLFVY